MARRPRVPCTWSNRCTRRPSAIVTETERYCTTHARKVADRLVGRFVKNRDGWKCQRCGEREGEQMQYAHVISRGARFIQYEPDNAVCLCRDCHYYFTMKPGQWSVWLAAYRPGLHDRMALLEAARERQGGGVDLAAIIETYRREYV